MNGDNKGQDMFKKYESFNPCDPRHVELLKNHQFYCEPGTEITIIDETDQPERLNPETQHLLCQMCKEKELNSENPPFLCQSCKKKDQEMGRYYGNRIRIVEMR